MLVLIQVSSMKTRRWGSRLACHDRQRRRRRATSARPCSRANSVFFESQSFDESVPEPICTVRFGFPWMWDGKAAVLQSAPAIA
jgi:hypothetical protein